MGSLPTREAGRTAIASSIRATREESEKAKALANSSLFDPHRWSDWPEVSAVVHALYAQLRTDGNLGRAGAAKAHLKVVALNLYAAYLTDPARYCAFRRDRNAYYGQPSRYLPHKVTGKLLTVVDALIKHGYVKQHVGFRSPTPGESRISRMRATPKLIDLIARHRVESLMIDTAPDRECIILRDDKKRDSDYPENRQTVAMRFRLCAYNDLLRRTFIDIPNFPPDGVADRSGERRIRIDRTNKFVRRIFSRDFDHGGRFYGGWWQSLPKEWRIRIRINDQPVVELDYSALHIMILYALEGIDYRAATGGRDPYWLDGYEKSDRMRDLLKLVLLCMVNAKDRKSAIAAVRSKVNSDAEAYGWIKAEGFDLPAIVQAFEEAHAPILHRLYQPTLGVRLQRIDSMMAERVIDVMTGAGIPVLAIHDSFVTGSRWEDMLRGTMSSAYLDVLNDLTPLADRQLPSLKLAGLTKDQWQKLTQLGKRPDDQHAMQLDEGYAHRLKMHRATNWERVYFRTRIPDLVLG